MYMEGMLASRVPKKGGVIAKQEPRQLIVLHGDSVFVCMYVCMQCYRNVIIANTFPVGVALLVRAVHRAKERRACARL